MAMTGMTPKDMLLAQVGAMEGRTVSRGLAKQCREMVGAPPPNVEVQLMLPQLIILLILQKCAGHVTMSVEDIDDIPGNYLMLMQSTKIGPEPAIKFWVEDKKKYAAQMRKERHGGS